MDERATLTLITTEDECIEIPATIKSRTVYSNAVEMIVDAHEYEFTKPQKVKCVMLKDSSGEIFFKDLTKTYGAVLSMCKNDTLSVTWTFSFMLGRGNGTFVKL